MIHFSGGSVSPYQIISLNPYLFAINFITKYATFFNFDNSGSLQINVNLMLTGYSFTKTHYYEDWNYQ